MTRAEHVGELELELLAPSAAGLFEQAARLLAAEEAPDADLSRPAGDAVEVELPGGDLAALLVDWVNELVYLTERDGRAYPEARVSELSERALRASLRGVEGPVRHAVKAATFHGVEVREEGGAWRGRVLLDV
jgi:SHS2 domain-containing protein